MTLSTSLVIAYGCLGAVLQLLWMANRIPVKKFAGWMAVLDVGGGVLSAANGWTTNVYLHAGFTAWFAWIWWTSGGGDDTKRRLKSWASRFQGVRRTAPSHT